MTLGSLFARRFVLRGTLTVHSPLHVGSGDYFEDDTIAAREESLPAADSVPTHPESARVVRDAELRPYIPGSSIKGALRAIVQRASEREDREGIIALFGIAKDEGGGTMGAFTVFGAEFCESGTSDTWPAFKEKNHKAKTGLAISARTSIDKGRGVVEPTKLFYAEEVVPGATFSFRACYQPPSDRVADDAARRLLGRILGVLTSDGFALGRGTGDGAGRVMLSDLRIDAFAIGQDGVLRQDNSRDSIVVSPDHGFGRAGFRLRLACNGPFFVNDWSWDPNAPNSDVRTSPMNNSLEMDDEKGPQLRALRAAPREPILPGTSLMGAFRARASWIEALMVARKELDLAPPGTSLVERLFGTTERRGRLVIDRLELESAANTMRATSVKLDRFSGAPIDGALFSVDCFVDPVFIVAMRLLCPNDSHEARLHRALMADLQENGLILGHAGNRGFGWFSVCQVAEG